MAKPGPDDRPGYKNVEVVEGYNRWASTSFESLDFLPYSFGRRGIAGAVSTEATRIAGASHWTESASAR